MQSGEVFLGVDIGSVTTKLVLVDGEQRILWSAYRKTMGQPISVLQSCLSELAEKFNPAIKGVGATGSGRRLVSYLLGADIVKNEITAHAIAALAVLPDVRTIIEIGGQDSKLIIVRNGVVVDFAMNTVCAAGTGSFLEHQAQRLGIPIERIRSYALSARDPVRIAGRCTVFAESDMVHKQQSGHCIEDIVAGLCDALCRNYLSNLARGKEIRDPVLFQGGVAANEGIRTAFEKELAKRVAVPAHFNIMGALGAALLAKERAPRKSKFRGLAIAQRPLVSGSFQCSDCQNGCRVLEIRDPEGIVARWGDNCGKWAEEV
ncbi:MAG: acyl-CoA dehydratase activase, partial [Thermodesulfovibrionales bacterium]